MNREPALVVRPGALRSNVGDGLTRLYWPADAISLRLDQPSMRLIGEFAVPRAPESLLEVHPLEAHQTLRDGLSRLVAAGALIEVGSSIARNTPTVADRQEVRSINGGVFGLPILSWHDAINAGSDTIVVGVPTDSGTTYRPGARFGPSAIRRLSRSVMTLQGGATVYDAARDTSILEERSVADVGDICEPARFDVAAVHAIVQETIERGVGMVALGGDHSISLPAVRASAQATGGNLGVIHIDAHFDYGRPRKDPDLESTDLNHGNFLDWIVGDVNVGQVIQVGVRQLTRTWPEPSAKRAVWPGRQAIDDGVAELVSSLDASRPWYLTVDIDVLDPSAMPDTGAHVPGGWFTHELIDLIDALGKALTVVAADLVEYLPTGDEWPGVTASRVLAHILEAVTPWTPPQA